MTANFSSLFSRLLPWMAPVAIAGLALAFVKSHPFVYVTEPGKSTVVFNSFTGLQKGKILPPGAAMVSLFDRPITYDVRTRVWEFTSVPNSPHPAGSPITVITSDGQSFVLDANVALHPNPDTLDELHARIGENYINTVVVPVVRSKLRDVSAQFDSVSFYRSDTRQEIQKKALEVINKEMPRSDRGVPLILVESIYLETAVFPPALKESLENRQVALILAQTAKVRAQIQEKETQRTLILAKANEQAIQLKGEAAAGNAQLADFLLYERLEQRIKAKQNPPKVIRVEGNSTVFLNVDPHRAAAANSSP